MLTWHFTCMVLALCGSLLSPTHTSPTSLGLTVKARSHPGTLSEDNNHRNGNLQPRMIVDTSLRASLQPRDMKVPHQPLHFMPVLTSLLMPNTTNITSPKFKPAVPVRLSTEMPILAGTTQTTISSKMSTTMTSDNQDFGVNEHVYYIFVEPPFRKCPQMCEVRLPKTGKCVMNVVCQPAQLKV
ncbi:uncharacterized protein LOC121875458 [Homarus americanus]|uniref:FZ domain-containing protein n=1 Tax=Homarus americanus TaxID=6706 RepID=A0A8J5JMR9_HOMAM|nr:uncharacterized protein LOC121875458 [Homarus americanus]KAG7161127.1 hypothetical protein Hamer_G023511 [Homarus americanus]